MLYCSITICFCNYETKQALKSNTVFYSLILYLCRHITSTVMLKLLLIVTIIVALAFLLLGINVFLLKRKFPETEVGRNKDMMQLGLTCPKCDEKRKYRYKSKPVKLNPGKLRPDWSSILK